MDNLGQRLKDVRLEAGLTLRELARQADVSPSLVSRSRTASRSPRWPRSTPSPGSSTSPSTSSSSGAGGRDVRAACRRRASRTATRRATALHRHGPDPRLAALGVRQPDLGGAPLAPPAPDDGRGGGLGAAGRDPGEGCQLHEDRLRCPGATSTADGDLLTHEGYEYGYVLSGRDRGHGRRRGLHRCARASPSASTPASRTCCATPATCPSRASGSCTGGTRTTSGLVTPNGPARWRRDRGPGGRTRDEHLRVLAQLHARAPDVHAQDPLGLHGVAVVQGLQQQPVLGVDDPAAGRAGQVGEGAPVVVGGVPQPRHDRLQLGRVGAARSVLQCSRRSRTRNVSTSVVASISVLDPVEAGQVVGGRAGPCCAAAAAARAARGSRSSARSRPGRAG